MYEEKNMHLQRHDNIHSLALKVSTQAASVW